MSKPFFSIITCTYDSEKYLLDNLESVSDQTFTDFEHVFIDGNSKDGTRRIIEKYGKRQDYEVTLVQALPKGISDAFNLGVDRSKGEYLVFLNSDDSLHDTEVLKDVSAFLKNKDTDWIYAKIQVVGESGEKLGIFPNHWVLQQASNWLLKYIDYIPHQSVFIKRRAIEEHGKFDTRLSSGMDTDLWMRIAGTTSWNFFDRVISNYLVRSGAQSSDFKKLDENVKSAHKVKKRYLNWLDFQIYKIIYNNIMLRRVRKKLLR